MKKYIRDIKMIAMISRLQRDQTEQNFDMDWNALTCEQLETAKLNQFAFLFFVIKDIVFKRGLKFCPTHDIQALIAWDQP
jgi:hypothetical protein